MRKDLSMYRDDVVNFHPATVLSGVENDIYWKITTEAGFDRVLMSYHYLGQKPKEFLANRIAEKPHVRVMVDSGAYTFHQKEDEYKDKPWEFWEDYLDKYVAFIRHNKDYLFCAVELDIGHIVGLEKLEWIRENYFLPLKQEGILICYVWHTYQTQADWKHMCRKYDMCAFSLQNADLGEREIAWKMNVAKQYGTLIHGLAMTRVGLMTKHAFYSADSTTWLIGTQYGEVNFFNGREMKRLKKDKWKRLYKTKLIQLGAQWHLAEAENPYELIRMNCLSFKEADEFIKRRVRAKIYWTKELPPMTLKKKTPLRKKTTATLAAPTGEKKQTKLDEFLVNSEPVDEAPAPAKKKLKRKPRVKRAESPQEAPVAIGQPKLPRELLNLLQQLPETFEDIKGLSLATKRVMLESVNIPAEDTEDYECEDLLDLFRTLFRDTDDACFESPEWREYLMGYYTDLTFIDVETFEEARRALTERLLANVEGTEQDFLPEEDELDDITPVRPKERDHYPETTDYELVDLTKNEEEFAFKSLQDFLPSAPDSDMPEVDELDAELAKMDIVAVRDEKGKFLKGQRKVRKPRNLYSEQFPKLACNTCYKAGDCPEYKPDHVCAYVKEFQKFDTRNGEDVFDAMASLVNLNLQRTQRAAMFEVMDGGMADGAVSNLIDQNMKLLQMMSQLDQAQIIAERRRTVNANGDVTDTAIVRGNPGGGGILAQLFGGGGGEKPSDKVDDVIDL